MSEKTITEDDVRDEHLVEVNPTAHWIYVFGVVVGSTILMIVFIALLGGGS
jgi:hypothetical protein